MAKYGCPNDTDGDGNCYRHPKGCYKAEVSREMLRVYGITWDDACGDDEPLIRSENDGDTPAEFVEWWGNRYNLIPKENW